MNASALVKQVLPKPIRSVANEVIREAARGTAAWRPLPDFVILGTKRGGTTSLWNYLLQHPLVLPMVPAAANMKSPHYYYWHYDRGQAWYRRHFATTQYRGRVARRAGHAPVTGEASPMYLYDPRVTERIRQDMPQVRLIILLRDPVERAYSHFKERRLQGVEPLSFEDALASEADRLEGELDRMMRDPHYYSRPYDWYTYRDRGVYLPQVRRWREHFPNNQLLILPSEHLYADPAATFDRVVSFLGLPASPLRNAKRYNYQPSDDMTDPTRRELAAFYADHNAELAQELNMTLPWSQL